MKKYLVPVGAGVLVFGAVTAFAASLTINTTSLGSGNATVASCNTAANVSYTTAAVGTVPTQTYEVATTPVTTTGTGTGCANMAYKVSLLGASGVLSEQTGTLSATGTATGA